MVWFDGIRGRRVVFKRSEYKNNPLQIWKKYQNAIKEAKKDADYQWGRLWEIRVNFDNLKELVHEREEWDERGLPFRDSNGRIPIPKKIIAVGMTLEEQGFLSITTDDYYWPLTYDRVLKKLDLVRKYHTKAENLEKERDYYFPKGGPKEAA